MNLSQFALLSFSLTGVVVGLAPHPAAPKPVKGRSVTYAKDVAPILYAQCTACHHKGEVAPFALMTYDEAKAKAKTIAAVVDQHYMPPWQAVAAHGTFANERTLSDRQVETLKLWAEQDAPAGNLSTCPKPPVYNSNWTIGQPDFIARPAKPYAVAADGPDDYRCFVVPTHFDSDRYVTDVELKPGSRKVVHHILVYIDTSGEARKKDGKDGKPGYESFGGPGFGPAGTLGGWAPGLQPLSMPHGDGMWLPKGADIVLQVHYHKDGKAESDLSEVGLKFATSPVDKRVRWQSIGNVLMTLPAGEKRAEVTADMTLSTPLTLLDVIPHMHLLGHDMEVVATLPNGSKRELIHVDNYDFNWQTRYTYKAPIKLPAGTHVSLVAHYDNSSANTHNPNTPPKTVHFGEQTTDEMCFAFFSFTKDNEHLLTGKPMNDSIGNQDRSTTYDRLFTAYDTHKHGWLDRSEIAKLVADYGLAGKEDPNNVAGYIVAMYGKSTKGHITKTEFIRMANDFSN